MSSSDDRRRTPRVAGQRRRARSAEPTATPATTAPVEEDVTTSVSAPTAVGDAPQEVTEPREAAEPAAARPPDPSALEPGEPSAEGAGGRRVPRALLVPLVALGVALALLVTVVVVTLGDPQARDRDARAATAAARADLEQLLSYSHETLAQQAQQNAALLTGPFKDEYASTMAKTILPVAQKEKATVQARSYEAGVMAQTADTVTVQVFVNQAKTSEAQEQPSVDQNRVIATMKRVGDRWLIARLEAY